MSTRSQISSWNKTVRDLGPRQREVIELLMRFNFGLSAWEIADKTKHLVHAVRPRLTELRALGLIRQTSERWEIRTQRHEAVWVAIPFEDDGQMKMAI